MPLPLRRRAVNPGGGVRHSVGGWTRSWSNQEYSTPTGKTSGGPPVPGLQRPCSPFGRLKLAASVPNSDASTPNCGYEDTLLPRRAAGAFDRSGQGTATWPPSLDRICRSAARPCRRRRRSGSDPAGKRRVRQSPQRRCHCNRQRHARRFDAGTEALNDGRLS